MKRLLFIFVLLAFTKSYSQQIVQTYVDRCTGVVYTFSVPINGQTVVVFYNRSQTFTAQQFTNGTLQAWLEQTYTWWETLNPCSANQASTTTTQQTAQQTTAAATQAASNATSTPPPATPPPAQQSSTSADPPQTSTNTSQANGDTTDNTSTGTSGQQTEGNNSEGQTGESSPGSNEDSGGGGSTEGETTDNGENSPDGEESTEEVKQEESKDEKSDESSEKESKEESEEETSDDENSEGDEEEKSEEESDDKDEKKEDKDRKKKRNVAPPVLAANLMSMQMLDGTWSSAASFGISQSSLTGQETYSANAMIWSNLKQFSLGVSKSKVHLWREYEGVTYLVNPITSKQTLAINPKTGKRFMDRQNQIHHVGSTSLNFLYMYGTMVASGGYSRVILGQNDNFWKGFAGGYAATASYIMTPESKIIAPSLILFGTKPFQFKFLPRWSFSPMVATSFSPYTLSILKNNFGKFTIFESTWNENFTYILGSNINFALTQRFAANLGINTINNTDPAIPTSFAITIGARFAF